MNILILHPNPALKRYEGCYQTCEYLNQQGHHAVFTYNGPELIKYKGNKSVYWFDGWVDKNRETIEQTSIIDLEKRYPKSNFWLGAVSERRYTDYSLLYGSYRSIGYPFDELNFILKALVLFYQEIFDKENIDAVLAEHPDNIHSTMIFEICRSLNVVSFLLFPDYYWERNHYYLFDSKYFTSTLIKERYLEMMQDYDTLVAPRMEMVNSYLAKRLEHDPKDKQKKELPRLNLKTNTLNGLDVIKKQAEHIVFKAAIVKGFYQFEISKAFKAYIKRNLNLFRRRFTKVYSHQLPDVPFVYFPLQRVPEAAMLVRATAYLNQQSFIQSLSASLPAGYCLVVKDHPRNRGMFPVSYYEQISQLPNVVLIEDEFSNHTLLEKTQLLITIAGTLGFQQLMHGRPVMMFGRKFYEIIDGVIRVDDMNELPYRLKNILIENNYPDTEIIKRSMTAFIMAMSEHRYESTEPLEKIYFNPQALSQLISDMIEHDVSKLLKKRGYREQHS